MQLKMNNMLLTEKDYKEFVELVRRMREAQKEVETCMHEEYELCVERINKADNLESEVDEYLKKMEDEE